MNSSKKFYATTPIYYVTAKPHLGSLYSTVLADIAARWEQLKGKETFLLTGTDEYGQKIAQAAEKVGKQPKEFVDSFIPSYTDVWKAYYIDYNYFVRTTDPEHVKAVQVWIEKLKAQGDIYKSAYSGWYCTPCETYLTDKEAEDNKQGKQINCPSCGRETSWISEDSYFFKLSAYQDKLLAFYEKNPNFITPKERSHEVISFVKEGLRDLSISRTTISWGVPFPNDPEHVVYVWADALNNYISAIGYGNLGKEDEFKKWWPADLHVLGKDIVRFHAVYWPAFLMAAGLEQPKKLLVHGWIKVGQEKMSKSLGNVVDPQVLLKNYGADEVRYYLARQLSVNQDSSFTVTDLEQRITSDLANDLGNLLNRTLTLAEKNNIIEVQPPSAWSQEAVDLRDACFDMLDGMQESMNTYQYHIALGHVWKYINKVNAYFHAKQPWKLAKQDAKAFAEVISAVSHSLYVIGTVLVPIMPKKMDELLLMLGCSVKRKPDVINQLVTDGWDFSFTLQKPYVLFNKIETKKEIMETKTEEKKEIASYISIDDVAKLQLAVGTITECNEVEGSDKLLHLTVDLGEHGIRSVASGIKKIVRSENIVGKQGIFVINLKPRKVFGIPSEAMLFVGQDSKDVLNMIFLKDTIPNGSLLR